MRPTWKGSISFGLVYIPIAVYPATREEKISFRQLRKTDLSPIRYKKVAEADMKEVPADQIVKGYEYERGRYIILNDEDFEKVRIESTHSPQRFSIAAWRAQRASIVSFLMRCSCTSREYMTESAGVVGVMKSFWFLANVTRSK